MSYNPNREAKLANRKIPDPKHSGELMLNLAKKWDQPTTSGHVNTPKLKGGARFLANKSISIGNTTFLFDSDGNINNTLGTSTYRDDLVALNKRYQTEIVEEIAPKPIKPKKSKQIKKLGI